MFCFVAVEELECRAVWREGSNQFLLGRVTKRGETGDDESSLRCFSLSATNPVLPLVEGGFTMARSADATCNGIYSPTEGPTVYVVQGGTVQLGHI